MEKNWMIVVLVKKFVYGVLIDVIQNVMKSLELVSI